MLHVEESGQTYHREEIKKKIQTEVSGDNYEAYIIVDEPDAQLSEVRASLEANSVVYGIDDNALLEALKNQGMRTLAAIGSRHTDGKDGWFERVENHPQTEAEKKFGICNICEGEIIGIVHKPTQGSVGVDVFGKKIQPKQGKRINFFTSPNIKRTETETQITLEAAADGNLKIGNASIEVITEHTIRQDIDYSDGEIEFAGSLRIMGDVKGSGNLNVKHNVFIQGSVEDAKIISGGDVVVKGSFVGRGDGIVRSKGNIEAHVILNQTLEAGESITITKESVNGRLVAADTVYAPHAVIMGGVVTAGNKIEVRTLGGELYSTTRVRLGIRELATEDALAIDKEIEFQKKIIEEIKNKIYLLVRDRIDGSNFTEEKAENLKLSQNKLQEITDQIKSLASKKQETSIEMSRRKSPKLIVLGTIHPSVVMEISGVHCGLKQSFNNVTFEESKNEIVRTKNI
ncbi:MAG TPA: FapA family protein [Candidatus Acidoferrales bacterium]|nr:FapA family protein [Candidatus Acidoferrales bacterium]